MFPHRIEIGICCFSCFRRSSRTVVFNPLGGKKVGYPLSELTRRRPGPAQHGPARRPAVRRAAPPRTARGISWFWSLHIVFVYMRHIQQIYRGKSNNLKNVVANGTQTPGNYWTTKLSRERPPYSPAVSRCAKPLAKRWAGFPQTVRVLVYYVCFCPRKSSRTCLACRGFTETNRRRHIGQQPGTKSASRPASKPRMNRLSTAGFVPPSV